MGLFRRIVAAARGALNSLAFFAGIRFAELTWSAVRALRQRVGFVSLKRTASSGALNLLEFSLEIVLPNLRSMTDAVEKGRFLLCVSTLVAPTFPHWSGPTSMWNGRNGFRRTMGAVDLVADRGCGARAS